MAALAPSFFISHGAPTFALEPGLLGPGLLAAGRQVAGVKAVLIVSPHWQTRGVTVMTTPAPPTIHDFGGFPAPLYQLQYPASGAPDVAMEAGRLLAEAGFAITHDAQRGLDHGAWVPLRYLFPKADVPVFQVSMPQNLTTAEALRMGRALAPLREQGVMIVGSGSLTHNLYEVRRGPGEDAAYARAFAGWTRQAVSQRDVASLVGYRDLAPAAERAHPTEEHYLPLLVAIGASGQEDRLQVIEGGITYGVLAMDSYAWG